VNTLVAIGAYTRKTGAVEKVLYVMVAVAVEEALWPVTVQPVLVLVADTPPEPEHDAGATEMSG